MPVTISDATCSMTSCGVSHEKQSRVPCRCSSCGAVPYPSPIEKSKPRECRERAGKSPHPAARSCQTFIWIGAADPAITGQQTSVRFGEVCPDCFPRAVAKRKTYAYSIINYLLGFIQFGSMLNRLQIGCGWEHTGLIMKVYSRREKKER